MPILREEVQHVAELARLGLTDAELTQFAAQVGHILDAMETIRQVDTSSISPTAQVIPLRNVMRADEARPSLSREAVLQNAPAVRGVQFAVPAVLTE